MTDPLEDRLRSTLEEAGSAWTPAEQPAAVRARLLYRLRRVRRHGWAEFAVPATLVVLAFAAFVVRSSDDPLQSTQPNQPAPSEERGAVGGPPAADGIPGESPSVDPSGRPQASTPQPMPPRGQTASPPSTKGGPAPAVAPSPAGPPPGSGPVASVTPGPERSIAPEPAGTLNETSSSSGVEGTVLFSPVCPVESPETTLACAPRPGAAAISAVGSDGSVAGRAQAGQDGRFKIRLSPGRYVLKASPPGNSAIGGCEDRPVEVRANAFKAADISCDTGIR